MTFDVSSGKDDAPGDASMTFDVSSGKDAPWRDTSSADTDATLRDTTGDGGSCACVDYEIEASTRLFSTSLECFGTVWGESYLELMLDPCLGLRASLPFFGYWGQRNMKTYPSANLIGIETSTQDGPIYQWFYDATTYEKVGAARTSSWFGNDPIYCTPIPVVTQGRYTTVRAGRLPNCNFSPSGADCQHSSRERLCPPPEAGAPDGGIAAPDSSDAELTDAAPTDALTDATSSDTTNADADR